MNKRRATNNFRLLRDVGDNTFSAFHSAFQWQEMVTASAVTISLRLAGMQRDFEAGAQPDMKEMNRMVSEKQRAMVQASAALVDWQESLVQQYWRQLGTAVPMSGPASLAAAAQQMTALNRWTAVSLKGFSRVMEPYHGTTTANARRLNSKHH